MSHIIEGQTQNIYKKARTDVHKIALMLPRAETTLKGSLK